VLIQSFISNIFNGNNVAYIYIWFSKSERFLYVGQTNELYGTIGRFYSHIQSEGTLRKRCLDRVGIEIEHVNDLYLFSFPLPQTKEFISNESSFRLAVEYRVQSGLHDLKSKFNPCYRIISNVVTSNHIDNSQVVMFSNIIIKEFSTAYPVV
jgi:hypothetical protein